MGWSDCWSVELCKNRDLCLHSTPSGKKTNNCNFNWHWGRPAARVFVSSPCFEAHIMFWERKKLFIPYLLCFTLGLSTYCMLCVCLCFQQMLNAVGLLARLNAGGYSVRGKCEFIFHNNIILSSENLSHSWLYLFFPI